MRLHGGCIRGQTFWYNAFVELNAELFTGWDTGVEAWCGLESDSCGVGGSEEGCGGCESRSLHFEGMESCFEVLEKCVEG